MYFLSFKNKKGKYSWICRRSVQNIQFCRNWNKNCKNTPRTRSEININCLFTIITCIIIIIIYLLLANNSLFLAPDTHFTFFILYSFKPGHSLKLFVMIITSYNLKLKSINYNSQESNRDAATNWQVKKHLHVFI